MREEWREPSRDGPDGGYWNHDDCLVGRGCIYGDADAQGCPVNPRGDRAVSFTFDGERTFTGWTDNTYWNGFLNVRVTPAERDAIVAYFIDDEDSGMSTIEPDADGRINLGWGFATYEVHYYEGDHNVCDYDAHVAGRECLLDATPCVTCGETEANGRHVREEGSIELANVTRARDDAPITTGGPS